MFPSVLPRLLRVGFSLLLAGCASQRPVPQPAATDRHLVVLVHGVYGNAGHFGAMADALEAHLGALNPGYRWEVVAFEYDSFSTTAGVDAFARDLGEFLVRTFGKAPPAGDRLSLVTHSQGGLVSMVWTARAASGEALFHPWLLEHLDAFVTLATPFWGSKMATWTRGLEPWRRAQGLPDPSPAAKQLVDMTFGSDQTARFRRTAIEVSREGLPEVLGKVRPLALGGYVTWLKPAAWVSTGEDEYEDDTAVPLPSSRPDFLYASAVDPGYAKDGFLLPSTAFAQTAFSPWTVVNAIHLSPVTDLAQVSPGIAQVPSACVDNLDCGHPSFRRVADHLAGKAVSLDTDALPAMTSFLLEVDVSLAPHDKGTVDPDALEVRIDFDEEQPDGVEVGRLLELYAAGRSPVAGGTDVQRHWFYGTAPASWHNGRHVDREVRFVVSAPQYKPRRVHARVRATWSTWVEVRLEPFGAPEAAVQAH